MQIVVTEHHDGVLAERTHETQHGQGVRAAVHEIAHEPQAIAVRRESDALQERPQLVVATLNVADREARQRDTY
jgi:hypothetical protein